MDYSFLFENKIWNRGLKYSFWGCIVPYKKLAHSTITHSPLTTCCNLYLLVYYHSCFPLTWTSLNLPFLLNGLWGNRVFEITRFLSSNSCRVWLAFKNNRINIYYFWSHMPNHVLCVWLSFLICLFPTLNKCPALQII